MECLPRAVKLQHRLQAPPESVIPAIEESSPVRFEAFVSTSTFVDVRLSNKFLQRHCLSSASQFVSLSRARMSSPPQRQHAHSPFQYENFFPPPPSPRGHGFPTLRPTVLLLAKALLVPLASAAPLSLFRRNAGIYGEEGDEPPKSTDDPDLYLYLGIAVALVLLGGVFAGLTIALMGQDETYLQVIATSGEERESKHATKVLNLLKKGKHWVLVTLLLSNVITNETLPIVLDRSLGGGWPAVLSSTVLIGRPFIKFECITGDHQC